MLLLGHAGITLGAAMLASGALPGSKVKNAEARLKRLASYLDIRLLFIGALLPDIIDKPLGHLIFKEELANGRVFSHSILFVLLIMLAGFIVFRKTQGTWLLALAGGSVIHLILDGMWLQPETFYWPFFGFSYEKTDVLNWIPNMISGLINNPSVYIPEITGAALLIWFGVLLLRIKMVKIFILRGKVL